MNFTLIEGSVNQYSLGVASACTHAALEAAVLILHSNPEPTPELVDHILGRISASTTNKAHPEITELLGKHGPFYNRLSEQSDVQIPSQTAALTILGSLKRIQAKASKRHGVQAAFVLIGLGMTVLAYQKKQKWVLFNSHSSPDHANAAMLVFNSFASFRGYLSAELFPTLATEGPLSVQEEMASLVRIVTLTLPHASSKTTPTRASTKTQLTITAPPIASKHPTARIVHDAPELRPHPEADLAFALELFRKEEADQERIRLEREELARQAQREQEVVDQRERDEALARELQAANEILHRDMQQAHEMNQQFFSCPICATMGVDELEAFRHISDKFVVAECQHVACRECVMQWANAQIADQRLPVKCFISDCECSISQTELSNVLNDDAYLTLVRHGFRTAIQGGNFWSCPQPDCEGVIEVDDIDAITKIDCYVCQFSMCVKCRAPWHADQTCEAFQQWRTDNQEGDQRFQEYLQANGGKNCPGCGIPVELLHGCNHMTCTCNTHFCLVCTTVLDPANPYQHFNEGGARCPLFHVPAE